MIGKVILLTFIVTGLNLGVPAVTAAETTVQRLDSINADPNANKTVVEQVYRLILKMVDRWNKHDLEGYMAGFWKSDDLLTVVESEVHWGWTDIYNNYARGYPDRKLMGQLDLQRLQVRSSTKDTAVALCWRRILPPQGGSPLFATDTMQVQKFAEGWRITVEHTSFVEP